MDTAEPDVLVVGAGPAGVTAALLLADAGVTVEVVDKRRSVSPLPRARGIHARAVEILRLCGVEVAMRARELAIASRMEIRPNLAQPALGAAMTGGPQLREVSPCEGIAIAQDVFETVLREHLAIRGRATVRLGVELTDLRVEQDGGLTAELADQGTGATITRRPRFLVGADGWRSTVRTKLGIQMAGPDDLGTSRSLLFRADLTRWLGEPPPALVRLEECAGVLVRTHADHRWVLILADDEHPPADPVQCIRGALGLDIACDVLGDSRWVAAAQVADRFSKGPVFLVGDAAHRVPPAGATGISSAMADVHNLTWKLAAVLRGQAPPRLLETYAVERRAVAATTTQAALDMWRSWATAATATATDLRVLDMGYIYTSPVIANDRQPNGTPRQYVPSARPGARAPHVWIDLFGRRASTIDLFGRDFVLLTNGTGAHWAGAAVDASDRTGVPLSAAVRPEPDVGTAYELGEGEGVLVRPDGHIAWRSGPIGPDLTPGALAQQLSEALLVATAGSAVPTRV